MQAAILMAVIIIAAGGFVWFGINFGLKPLLQLREAVERRSPADLTPIRRPVPREVKSLVDAMNTLFGRLASAFVERDQLIANAAHQLRNPIAGLQAQAEAATSAPNERELRIRAQGVAEAARRTSRLTTQLLSMERMRGRAARARDTDVDLAALAAEVTRAHAPPALRRGASLSLDIEGTAAPIRGDPVLLAEALDNLVDNALRYGCRDGGTIRVRVVFETDRTRLIVEDDGPGVPADQRERVFERFHRGVEDGSDGCGLGLAIAWGIAERHGGAVRLVDSPSGARFELELPSAAGTAGDRTQPAHIT